LVEETEFRLAAAIDQDVAKLIDADLVRLAGIREENQARELGTSAARRQGRKKRNLCGGSGRSGTVQVFPCDKTCHAEDGEEKVWEEFAEHGGARVI